MSYQSQWSISCGLPTPGTCGTRSRDSKAIYRKYALAPRLVRFVLGTLFLSCAFGSAQTTSINLATQGRNADFSNFPFTRPATVGATLPTGCQVGQLFFNSTAAPGTNLYACTAANTWTTLAGTGIPTPSITIAPSTLSFGNQTVGTTSAAKSLTLSNIGTTIFIAVRYHGQRWQLERFPGIEYLRQHFSVWGNLHIVGQFQAKLRCSRDDGHSRQRKSARISPSRDGNRNRHIRDHQRRPGGYTLGNICL